MSANADVRSYFRASLRLWSSAKPLTPLLRASEWDWTTVHIKGEIVPARGRTPARVAPRHYACSEDPVNADIANIVLVLAHWLDAIERHASTIIAAALAGEIEAVLWIAIIGDNEIATPELPSDLTARASKAGVQILLENYTTPDPEDGNSAKTFLGARRKR